MLDGVLMHVVQPRQVGLLVGEPGIPEVVPDLPTVRMVEAVDPAGAFGVKPPQHLREVSRSRLPDWGMTHEMVVIGEDGPSFELPAELLSEPKQAPVKHPQPVGPAKVVCFEVSRSRDEIGSGYGQPMRGGMRPGDFALGHGGKVELWREVAKTEMQLPGAESGTGVPHSKTLARGRGARMETGPVTVRTQCQSGTGVPHSKTLARGRGARMEMGPVTVRTQCQSGTGVPHSKTLARDMRGGHR